MAAANSLPLPPLLMISGKGGVGKTTIAAALAFLCSARGERVLLVSTDPAHNLADLFTLAPAKAATSRQITARLTMEELDPQRELDQYLEQAEQRIKPYLAATAQPMLNNYLDFVRNSPGSSESAIFHRLALLIEQHQQGNWQRMICDTAPSGHTLQLLRLPQQIERWGSVLDRQQQRSDLLQQYLLNHNDRTTSNHDWLQNRRKLYRNFNAVLRNPEKSGIILALEAQRLAIAETERTAAQLTSQGIRPYAICLNRLLPPSDGLNDFFAQRYEVEKVQRRQLEQRLVGYPCWQIPLQAQDIDQQKLPELATILDQQITW